MYIVLYYYRPLAIRAEYSRVPILGVILGVKIIYKHAQKRVDVQYYALCLEVRSVLCKKSIAPPCITRTATGTLRSLTRFYAQKTAIVQ